MSGRREGRAEIVAVVRCWFELRRQFLNMLRKVSVFSI